jgi:hypothetical protein
MNDSGVSSYVERKLSGSRSTSTQQVRPFDTFPALRHVSIAIFQRTMKTLRCLALTGLLATAAAFVGCKTHESSQTAAAKPYPLDKCVVSNEKLGEHGQPYVFVHDGEQVKLCCKDCLADFNKDPDKYMAKIAAAK